MLLSACDVDRYGYNISCGRSNIWISYFSSSMAIHKNKFYGFPFHFIFVSMNLLVLSSLMLFFAFYLTAELQKIQNFQHFKPIHVVWYCGFWHHIFSCECYVCCQGLSKCQQNDISRKTIVWIINTEPEYTYTTTVIKPTNKRSFKKQFPF